MIQQCENSSSMEVRRAARMCRPIDALAGANNPISPVPRKPKVDIHPRIISALPIISIYLAAALILAAHSW
jgi:hypothetical protein